MFNFLLEPKFIRIEFMYAQTNEKLLYRSFVQLVRCRKNRALAYSLLIFIYDGIIGETVLHVFP